MTNDTDMNAPATRTDVNAALDNFAARLPAIIEAVVEPIVSRLVTASENRLYEAIGAAARESEREFNDRLRIVESEYRDLPKRVSKLEAKVFPPKRRATAARRKRS